MSEVIKYITDKLTSPPFNRNFNYITFDELEPNLLLQLLSDVLGELDPKHKIDIRDEAPEATTMRILEALRVLRYKIPTEPDDLSELCESLIIGDKKCIYPIMESILQNFDEHKKRSYLSKFLTKVRVPADFMQDSELNKLYSEHEALIEAFKNTHKQLETIKHKSLSTCEVKNDISVMQEEKDQLLRRINRMKMKVENFPSSIMMLDVARKLRLERERKAKLAHQLQQQRIMIGNLEDKVVELRQQSNELQRRSADCNAENLLSRLQEEVKINQYLAIEKQPKEIEEAKTYLEDLRRIANQPALTYSYLNQLNQKLHETQEEICRLIEKHMTESDPFGDKVMIFRQHANIAANKKASTASTLAEAREKHLVISKQLKDIQEKNSNDLKKMGYPLNDNEVSLTIAQFSTAEDLQNYVMESRTKDQTYKEKWAALNNLSTEKEILMKILDLLEDTTKEAEKKLDANEALNGINVNLDVFDNLEKESEGSAKLDEQSGGALKEMSWLVERLHQQISLSRDKLAPLIKELRSLREKAQELTKVHAEKKTQYDVFIASRDAQTLRLEQEVRDLREEIRKDESRYNNLNAALDNLKVQESRLQEEMRGYITSTRDSSPTNGGDVTSITVKRHSYREDYQKRISEVEAQIESLKEQQTDLDAKEATNIRQRNIWVDVLALFESKMISLQGSEPNRAAGGEYTDVKHLEIDRLVL